jgi:hypothetical protein
MQLKIELDARIHESSEAPMVRITNGSAQSATAEAASRQSGFL